MLVRSLNQASRRTASTSSFSSLLKPLPTIGFFTPNISTTTFRPRIANKSSLTCSGPRVAFSTSTARHEPSVPVVSWNARQRSEDEIQVEERPATAVVAPLEGDLQRTARPLNIAVLDKLTPTLSRFTLAGKVAIVTG